MAHASVQLVPESTASEGQSPTTTLALLLLTSEGALVHEFGEHVPATLDGVSVPSTHDSVKLPESGVYPESHAVAHEVPEAMVALHSLSTPFVGRAAETPVQSARQAPERAANVPRVHRTAIEPLGV